VRTVELSKKSWVMAGVALATSSLWACGGGGGTPTPTPTPPPAACTLGAGVQAATCGKQSTFQLGSKVDAAIDALISQRPEYFDTSAELNPGARDYRIKDVLNYVQDVAANLRAAGLCAEADIFNDKRVKVKNVADFHENYLVRTIDFGNGSYVQRAPASYDQTCNPAAFPLERNPDLPPPDQGCGEPIPPPVNDFAIGLSSKNQGVFTYDSTPRVTNNAPYCARLGYTDGRSFCPLRPEGHAERVACESWRIGIAVDTGRLGPTWRRDGALCTSAAMGCQNHEFNQFRLHVFPTDGKEHLYQACTDQGFCGDERIKY
jgi:hypothetical protein